MSEREEAPDPGFHVIDEITALKGRMTDMERQGRDHERTLYGHEDDRRRITEPGLVAVVSELASAFKDVKAVAKAGWALLGLVGVSTAISIFTLFVGAPG